MSQTAGSKDQPLEDELEMMGIPKGSYEVRPLDMVRKVVANRLTEASRDVPTFPLNVNLQMQALMDARAALNESKAKEERVSVNDMILKAAAQALVDVPEANASFNPRGIIMHKVPDVAMAVAIDAGLITPIVRNAAAKSLADIALETKDLAARAKKMRLKPDEYNGGTFCVSNLGMFGVSSFASIINPPQGAILSVGATEDRVVAVDGAPAVRSMATFTLTCDHRVIDGAIGARWLQAFRQRIEEPTDLT